MGEGGVGRREEGDEREEGRKEGQCGGRAQATARHTQKCHARARRGSKREGVGRRGENDALCVRGCVVVGENSRWKGRAQHAGEGALRRVITAQVTRLNLRSSSQRRDLEAAERELDAAAAAAMVRAVGRYVSAESEGRRHGLASRPAVLRFVPAPPCFLSSSPRPASPPRQPAPPCSASFPPRQPALCS